MTTHLHPPAGDNDEDDGGVARHGHQGDGAVEQGQQGNNADLKQQRISLAVSQRDIFWLAEHIEMQMLWSQREKVIILFA